MKKIITGKNPISIGLAAAVLSLALVVNLPGLAVSPMLAQLKTIFPHSTQLEEQLLSLMPNLVIIPFILLSGRLSLTRHKMAVIVGALILFVVSTIAYFFADGMGQLIVISAFLGAAAGLIIPFSTGLLSDVFEGEYRKRMMGFQSGISNLTLVVATFAVGLLGSHNWHLPFVVYLVALIPLCLAPMLRKIPAIRNDQSDNKVSSVKAPAINSTMPEKKEKSPLRIPTTWALIGVYFAITIIAMVIPLFTPYLAQSRGWEESITGTSASVFFLFLFIPGFFLKWFIAKMKSLTIVISIALMAIGVGIIALFTGEWAMITGAGICGLGYGIYQPIIYDKATHILNDDTKSTQVLSIVLSANYLAIVLMPEIVDLIRGIFHVSQGGVFSFILSAIVGVALLIVSIIFRKRFVFSD